MKLESNQPKASPEQVVKDIRRVTRRHYYTEDKYALFWVAWRVRTALLSCAARKVLPILPCSANFQQYPSVKILDTPARPQHLERKDW